MSLLATHRGFRAESMEPKHFEHRAEQQLLDKHYSLGTGLFADLREQHSNRDLAIQFSAQRCQVCRAQTSYFFVLACCRCCVDCFHNSPDVRMCTVDYAKVSGASVMGTRCQQESVFMEHSIVLTS